MAVLTLRGLLGRARRAALTVMVVAVGVAIITGTLVFTDTIHSAYQRLFAGAAQGAQLVVAGRQEIANDPSASEPVPQQLIARVRKLPGVSAAQGQISDQAEIVGRDGQVINSGRLPTSALSYVDPPFGGLRIVTGHPPRGPQDVVIDQRTATLQHYRVGDLVPIVTSQPVRRFRLAGTATLGGATAGETFVAFSLPAAQALFGKTGTVDLIDVAVGHSATTGSVSREIARLLPAGLVVRAQDADVDVEVQRASARLRSLTDGLLAFALVAIVVGALMILNTFSITATQRTAELAVLRALGATRGQVLRAVLLEALLVGLAGSAAGIIIGPLAAVLIRALLDAAGENLPSTLLVVELRTALIGVGTGVAVSLAAALLPALRASRAAPLEAVRISAAAQHSARAARVRIGVSALATLGGLGLILTATGASGERLRVGAVGGGLVIAGALIAAPLAVGGLARAVAWPVARRRGAIAGLAREQAIQNPMRTAISASSLTIGLALVVLVTAYTSGLRASAGDAIRQTFIGDLAIQSQHGTDSVPAATVQAAAGVPGVLGITGLKTAEAHLARAGDVQVDGIDPTSWGEVYRFDWLHGSSADLTGLAPGDALVEANTARAAGLVRGDRTVLVTGSGRRVEVRIVGVYRDAGLLRGLVLPATSFDSVFNQPRLQDVFVKLMPGPGANQVVASLQATLRRFPGVVVRSQRQLSSQEQADVASIVGLFYALLTLSLLMSLVGIAGTLNLSVHERTREIGILRALGMTGGQVQGLVRGESLITAAIGSVSGAVVGLVLAWAVTRALAADGFVFRLPWVALLAVLATGAAAGVLASVPPARRAARLDVLAAIAHE